MPTFPWQPFAFNALWILGEGVLLANLSCAAWLAREQDRPLGRLLSTPRPKRWLWLGLALIRRGADPHY